MLTDKQKRLQDTLDGLGAQPGVRGAVLVSRDGFCMMNRCPAMPAAETFSAMSATLFGAAEAAFAEFANDGPRRVIVESASARMVAEGAGGELILVAVLDASKPLADALKQVTAAAADVARAMST